LPRQISNGGELETEKFKGSHESVLEELSYLKNPLSLQLKKMKIDYNNGGFFNLFNKQIEVKGVAVKVDYQILIDSSIDERGHNDKYTKTDFCQSSLNGIGRIIQYSNDIESEWALMYEGEIRQGLANGFGRVWFRGQSDRYVGYFKNGTKYGLGLVVDESGKIGD